MNTWSSFISYLLKGCVHWLSLLAKTFMILPSLLASSIRIISICVAKGGQGQQCCCAHFRLENFANGDTG
jgi:hypothetical protein